MHKATTTFSLNKDLISALQLQELEEAESFEHHHRDYDFEEYEEEYDYTLDDVHDDRDYDDVCLAPPVTHKPKARRTRNKRRHGSTNGTVGKSPLFTKIVQPIIDSPKPLSFPIEVLELVCSHLSQSTLRRCVSLVCKGWNRVSDQYIRRVGVWTPFLEDYQYRLLEQMHRLDTLECWSQTDPDVSEKSLAKRPTSVLRDRWTFFRDALLAPIPMKPKSDSNSCDESNDGSMEQKPSCLLHHIRHLSFKGYEIHYKDMIQDMAHEFKFLRTLQLVSYQGMMTIPLFKLLDDCPSLVELTIKLHSFDHVYIKTGDNEDSLPDPTPGPPIALDTAHFPVNPTPVMPSKMYPSRYKIQVLHLDRCLVMQRVLERVISTCPKLRVLTARDINQRIWTSNSVDMAHYIDHTRLVEHAKRMCPDLEWYDVHRQQQHFPTDMDHIERIHTFFSKTKFLSLSCNRFQPHMPTHPFSQALFRQITVLEITWAAAYPDFYADTMNKILCLSPRLLHLIAPTVHLVVPELFPSDDEDDVPIRFTMSNRDRLRLEREERRLQREEEAQARLLAAAGEEWLPEDSKIWACRNLRTMDLKLNYDSAVFSAYIEHCRLLRNLTHLSLHVNNFHIGQLVEFPHVMKRYEKIRDETEMKRQSIVENVNAKFQLEKPKRHANDYLALRGLRSLEQLDIHTVFMPGMLHASDFEFLRPTSNETVVCIISHEQPPSLSQDGYRNGNDSGIQEEDIDEDELGPSGNGIEKKRNKSTKKQDTVWPRLYVFRIRYHDSALVTNYSRIISGVEDIRPALEFSIKQRFLPLD